MTSEEFKKELTIFAGLVEHKRAPAILVVVGKFRHKMSPEVQAWRVKNISSRYNTAGVQRFAFLFPAATQIPPMKSSPEETFLMRAFDDIQQAENWLAAGAARSDG
jgi:hypothetical protein